MIARDSAEREITVNEQWGAGRDTHYAYDQEGQISSQTLDVNSNNPGSGRATAYVYDELGQETQMTVSGDGPARTTESTFFPSGDLATLRKPNSTLESYRYRADGELFRRERDPAIGATTTALSTRSCRQTPYSGCASRATRIRL